MPKAPWFLYCLANFTQKSCPLCKIEIGEMLICNTMYVATYVKVKCIGKIIWKLVADTGEGVWGETPENVLLATLFGLLENIGNTLRAYRICYLDISLRRMSNCSLSMCHATILSTMHQSIQKVNYARDLSWLTCLDMGDFFGIPMYFSSSYHFWVYLPGRQPGLQDIMFFYKAD